MDQSVETDPTLEFVNSIPSSGVHQADHEAMIQEQVFSDEPETSTDHESAALPLAYQTIEVKGDEELRIILDIGQSESDMTQSSNWTENQELTVAAANLLPQGCLFYQCDDNIYKITYPVITTSDADPGMTVSGEDIQGVQIIEEVNSEIQVVEKQHYTNIGEETKEKEKSVTSYSCSVTGCGRQFSSLGYLKVHQLIHGCQKALVCTFEGCDRKFAWPAHLKYHMLTHLGKRPFVCDHVGCEKSFYTGQRLAVHKRTHTGEKPYVCVVDGCGKSFTTQGNLKNHARIHTGEKPYTCDFDGCNKGFTELSSLKKHKIIHSGRKPFVCDVCGQTFTQSGSRNVHVRKNHSPNAPVTLSTTVMVEQQVTEDLTSETPRLIVVAPNADQNFPQTDSSIDLTSTEQMFMSTSANVVVLSQPEEMVAITTTYQDDTSQEKTENNTVLLSAT